MNRNVSDSQHRNPATPSVEAELKFGTDGWRDVIAERFTFDNLARATQGYAEHLKEENATRVIVGYDTRFMSGQFARRAAEVLAANGLEVHLATDYLPTPALSFAVRHLNADGGVMITASHNPPNYNGFKLKGSYGGTASGETYDSVAARVRSVGVSDVARFDAATHTLKALDIRGQYYDALARLVSLDTLAGARAPLLHDAMGGAGCGWLTGFFEHIGLGHMVTAMRACPDPMFYGTLPEPIGPNLQATMETMRTSGQRAMFAVATDGDADRLGVVLPGGAFFNSHQIFAVLLDHLTVKGLAGKVVKTFTVSRLIERLARLRGLEVVETAVGFKYIAEAMLRGGVLIGGEESGGIGVSAHLPERDGLANALLLLEAAVEGGVGLQERFAALERETGWSHAYDRLDLHLHSEEQKLRAVAAFDELTSRSATIALRRVISAESLDGVKLNLEGNAWLLVRASGTEPVLRIYCEAPDPAAVSGLLSAARELAVAG